MFKRVPHLVLVLTSLLTIPYIAYPQSPASKTNDDSIKLSTELVLLDAQVADKKTGRFIGDLKKEDFELYEDGVKQQITHFSQDKLPLSIVLLLDVSGSVQPFIDRIRQGALRALQQLKPEDEVALMIFAQNGILIQDFTQDRQLIADKIGTINQYARQAGGGTFLNEGVYQAAVQVRKSGNPIGRRVIIAVTDNFSNQIPFMGHSEKKTTEELFESGSVLCGLIVRDIFGKVESVMQYDPRQILIRKVTSPGSVGTYAEKTGGEVIKANQDDVEGKLTELIEHLRTRYGIGYAPSNRAQDGKFRRVKLKLTPVAEKQKGDVAVKTKQGYYAGKQDNSTPAANADKH